MANFIQKVFNAISLQRDEKVWLSTDDSQTEKRLKLLAEFSETQFAAQLKLDCVSNAKNGKLSSALREKGNLCYAQGDCESALRLYNQVCFLPNFLAHARRFWLALATLPLPHHDQQKTQLGSNFSPPPMLRCIFSDQSLNPPAAIKSSCHIKLLPHF
jgi:hypothetical protein